MLKFEEFKKISTPEWKLKIQADLKGKDYNILLTKTPENIDIRPFYHIDSYKSFESNFSKTNFEIIQELSIADENIANKIAYKSLKKGIDKFTFKAKSKFDISKVINGIDAKKLIFKLDFLDTDFFLELYAKTQEKSQITVQPIGHLIKTGNWYQNQNKDFEKLQILQKKLPENYRFIEVDATQFQNAGATTTQQIAYGISQAVEYLENLDSSISNQLIFNYSIGNNYFFEIAKLRVLRQLWKPVLNEYKENSTAFIYASPSFRNKSLLDPHVNMLRSTMEIMSAIIGGADQISNISYDKIYKKSNAFSERIARNQLIILREEAGFLDAINSFNGSYFLENISNEILQKSLDIFKNIEKNGGLIAQLFKGKIQEKIKEKALDEQQKFDEGKLVLVGVNKYINSQAKIDEIEIYPFLKKRNEKTLIKPIVAKRLAEKKEKNILIEQGIEF